MKELKDIVAAYERASNEGQQCALATVVHLEGSAYRRPGARMLVTEDGKLTGAISGGCLEGDALRKAQLAMVQKKPMLVTYDTTDDDDAKLGVGLGCNGIISILIEPLDANKENNPIDYLKSILANRQAAVLVTVFSLDKKRVQPGTCMMLTEKGKISSSLKDESFLEQLMIDANHALQIRKTVTYEYLPQNELIAFIEIIEPPISVVIFGAGNDTMPIVEIAAVLGWETTVVDGRTNYATSLRFPSANRVIISKPDDILSIINFDPNTVPLLMTHNYNYDIAILRQLLPLHLPYIGALGPRKKLDRMVDELKEEGMAISENDLRNLFGPTGLDIGAETADEIALSIISEIKAVLSKRTGISLREKEEVIHPRETQRIIQSQLIL